MCGIQPGISIRVEEFGKVSVRVSELSQLRVEVFSYFGNGITLNFLPLLSPVSFFFLFLETGQVDISCFIRERGNNSF